MLPLVKPCDKNDYNSLVMNITPSLEIYNAILLRTTTYLLCWSKNLPLQLPSLFLLFYFWLISWNTSRLQRQSQHSLFHFLIAPDHRDSVRQETSITFWWGGKKSKNNVAISVVFSNFIHKQSLILWLGLFFEAIYCGVHTYSKFKTEIQR